MTKIYLEGYELDITEGLSNTITYAVDDIVNIDSKMTSFSKTIIIPGTAKNNNLFGNIFDFNNANFTDTSANVFYNFNASKLAKCRIEVNGLQIIKGGLRLLKIIHDRRNIEYEVAVFGELGNFISALGNKKLEDLDFSEYDHTYSVANIAASWDNWNAGQGYYYPLIDYGAVSTNKHDFQYSALRPAFFMREYLTKIIADAGFTFESNFFDTNFFKRIGIPHNQKSLRGNVDTNYVNATKTTDTTFSGSGAKTITFDSSILNNFTTSDEKTYSYSGTTPINTKVKVRLKGTYKSLFNTKLRLVAEINGVQNDIHDFEDTSNQFVSFDFITEIGATFNNLSTITIKLLNDFALSYSITVDECSLIIDKDPPGYIEILIGDTVNANNALPRGVFQKDFFTSILKLFNLIVTEDKYKENHLIIEPYVDFYNLSPSTYIDWTDKVDRSQVIQIEPMSQVNARLYQYSFKQDNDYYNEQYRKAYNEGYGDRLYDNGLEFVKDTDKLELIFSATPIVGYDGEDKVYSTIFKMSGNNEEQIDSNIRLMQFKKVTGVSSWDIKNGVTVLGSYTDYPYAGHLDDPDAPNADINFGVPKELYFTLVSGDLANNMFNAYYSPYMAEITDKDSRLVTLNVKLNDVDIFNLDFSKFIYIDGCLYRLIKVIDYNAGSNETTKVQLLRVIKTQY